MRRPLAFLALALAWVAAGHAPGAWACSCVGPVSRAHAVAGSDVVFTGKAVDVLPAHGRTPFTEQGLRWIFRVESVEKGPAPRVLTVSTARDGTICGFAFEVGRRYEVFAADSEDGLTTGLCSSTRLLAADERAANAQPPDSTPLSWVPVAVAAAGSIAVLAALAAVLTRLRRREASD